jgi:hypothetical protein
MATSQKVLMRFKQLNMNGDNLPKTKITKELNNTEYLIVDNNGTPFTVLLKDDVIYVYTNDIYPNKNTTKINELKKKYKYTEFQYSEESQFIKFYKSKLVKKISKFHNFFIGTDPDDPSYYSKLKIKKQNTGNTFLIGITPTKYWLIYRGIQEYIIKEPILEYYSMLGNDLDGIPDPIGFTKNKVIIFGETESIPAKTEPKNAKPWQWFGTIKDIIIMLNKKEVEKVIDEDNNININIEHFPSNNSDCYGKKYTLMNYVMIYRRSLENINPFYKILNKKLSVKLNLYDKIFDKTVYGKTIVKYID